MKDKIILVFYIGCHYLDPLDIPEYLKNISEHFERLRDETVETIFIPCREEVDSRVECINPKMISEEEYANVMETVNKFKEKYDEIIDNIRNGK